jgi:S-disulfanyl-L-cysteine oxidoreductase SoxD
MYKLTKTILTVSLLALSLAATAKELPGIGRTALPNEIAAWDIDVRGDFKGIPKGKGSVALGNKVWDEKCASCHGTFGESMEVFGPIVGGTTKEDMKTGHVLALADGSEPKRSTLMKVATLSTIWDYINRAMPWNAPKTLTTDEVYGVVAYILNMGEILPADFVLSNENIADVQKTMPNRNGMISELDPNNKLNHNMWKVRGKGDIKNPPCMKDCIKKVEITSVLPDYACDAHGNIDEQNRHFGAVRGADKLIACDPHPSIAELNDTYNAPYKPGAGSAKAITIAITKPTTVAPAITEATGVEMLKQNKCTACHGMTKKVVGPGFAEVAAKYKGDPKAESYLINVVTNGGSGVWGGSMPPHGHIKAENIKTMVEAILSGAK